MTRNELAFLMLNYDYNTDTSLHVQRDQIHANQEIVKEMTRHLKNIFYRKKKTIWDED